MTLCGSAANSTVKGVATTLCCYRTTCNSHNHIIKNKHAGPNAKWYLKHDLWDCGGWGALKIAIIWQYLSRLPTRKNIPQQRKWGFEIRVCNSWNSTVWNFKNLILKSQVGVALSKVFIWNSEIFIPRHFNKKIT